MLRKMFKPDIFSVICSTEDNSCEFRFAFLNAVPFEQYMSTRKGNNVLPFGVIVKGGKILFDRYASPATASGPLNMPYVVSTSENWVMKYHCTFEGTLGICKIIRS